MREVFVYYRVATADAAVAAREVLSMQAGLCASHPGLQARLLRRPADGTDPQTWMEVYCAAAGVDEALQREIEAAGAALRQWLQGPRHSEVFEAFAVPG